MLRFQEDLTRQIGEHRARGVIIDVAALDVLDSFATRTLRTIADVARLRGAMTVVVGIQPDVAYAMVRLGMGVGHVPTALDLEEGMAYLSELRGQGPAAHRCLRYATRTPRGDRGVAGRPGRGAHHRCRRHV